MSKILQVELLHEDVALGLLATLPLEPGHADGTHLRRGPNPMPALCTINALADN